MIIIDVISKTYMPIERSALHVFAQKNIDLAAYDQHNMINIVLT